MNVDRTVTPKCNEMYLNIETGRLVTIASASPDWISVAYTSGTIKRFSAQRFFELFEYYDPDQPEPTYDNRRL